MKILFILDLYKPHIGGVEVLFDNIISRLAQKGNKIVVLTSRFDKNLPIYEKISENIEIHRVGNNRYDFMFYSLLTGISFARECDIIHTTTYNSAIPASIIGILSRKKVVLTVHEIFGQLWYRFMGWKGFFFKLFESLIFKFPFDKYICVSNYTKNNLRIYFGLRDSKLKTIYNGMDYDFWNKANFNREKYLQLRKDLGLENNYVGLFFGRAGISKGLEFYIKAIPEIVSKIPQFKALLIVPDSINNPITKIENLIKKLNIKNNIVLLSGITNNEIPNYILFSDFVIIPSLAEGFGFAAVETCALGQNLIVTNIASLPEVVSGKVNFIEPANVSSIAQGVVNFKSGIYEDIADKRFEWGDNIESTLEVYKEVLEN